MLHEGAGRNSAEGRFRGEGGGGGGVWGWGGGGGGGGMCGGGRVTGGGGAGGGRGGVKVFEGGARRGIALLDAVRAARRWSDGWRGGVMQTCEFDQGWDAVA